MGQIRFLGIPVHVLSEADIDRERASQTERIYVVGRVTDFNSGSFGSPELQRRRLRTPCEGCREICYMDPKAFDSLRGMNLTILCGHCMLARIKAEQNTDG